jgi:hypothetical protein
VLFAVEGEGNEAVTAVDVKEAGPWRGWVCGGREGRYLETGKGGGDEEKGDGAAVVEGEMHS